VNKIRINVAKRSRALEAIFRDDILVFKNRIEVVTGISAFRGVLITRRDVNTRNLIGEESVRYSNIERVYPESTGEVYDWSKRVK